jgi:hypothetical protein
MGIEHLHGKDSRGSLGVRCDPVLSHADLGGDGVSDQIQVIHARGKDLAQIIGDVATT